MGNPEQACIGIKPDRGSWGHFSSRTSSRGVFDLDAQRLKERLRPVQFAVDRQRLSFFASAVRSNCRAWPKDAPAETISLTKWLSEIFWVLFPPMIRKLRGGVPRSSCPAHGGHLISFGNRVSYAPEMRPILEDEKVRSSQIARGASPRLRPTERMPTVKIEGRQRLPHPTFSDCGRANSFKAPCPENINIRGPQNNPRLRRIAQWML
jgi:hypothetical protein